MIMHALTLMLAMLGVAGTETDYAAPAHKADWLRHPVYGDPSFDAFERLPGNPIYRGSSLKTPRAATGSSI